MILIPTASGIAADVSSYSPNGNTCKKGGDLIPNIISFGNRTLIFILEFIAEKN